MRHKSDYSVTVFFPEGKGRPKKWFLVHNLKVFAKFLNKDHSAWKYMNVYDRRRRKFLKRFYCDNDIPNFIPTNSMS